MESPEEPLSLPEMQRQVSPFVIPGMQRQVSPGQMKALPMADTDPYPDDFFSSRGVELSDHLSTRRKRWYSLFFVSIISAFASGPISSWPTLEPILIGEGVWAGPDQELKLTVVYSLAVGVGMLSQTFAGIIYDAVGPRATAAGSAFGIVLCLLGMAIAIKVQQLNFLLWICYPAAVCLGYCNNMGGYAWLYLIPDSQNTVSSIVGAIQILSDSLVLLAVFFHDEFGLPLPFYFTLVAALSFLAGIVCLVVIPDHATNQKVTFVVTNPDTDEESSSYGPMEKSSKTFEVESFWDIVKRSLGALRDCCLCFLLYCPGASLLYLIGYDAAAYMFGVYPQFIMYPLYQAIVGTAEATTLVNIFGGLYACLGAVSLILFGRLVDYIGFEASIAFMNVPIILNQVMYCIPSFVPQVIGQALLSWQANAWYVLVPRWCLSYAPPQLYGSAFGISGGLLGVFQILGTPLGTLLSTWIDGLFTDHPSPAMPLLTTLGIWCFFCVFFSLAYLWFLRYYPMPAPGTTSMEDVMKVVWGADSDNFEKEQVAKKSSRTDPIARQKGHQKEVAQKSSTPTCAPCNCFRPQQSSN